jgi:hypothetical protein
MRIGFARAVSAILRYFPTTQSSRKPTRGHAVFIIWGKPTWGKRIWGSCSAGVSPGLRIVHAWVGLMVLSWGIIFVFTLRMELLEIQFENWSVKRLQNSCTTWANEGPGISRCYGSQSLLIVITPKAKTLILIEALKGRHKDLPGESEKIKDRYVYTTLRHSQIPMSNRYQ